MDPGICGEKHALRQQVASRVRAMGADQREQDSANARSLLKSQRLWTEAKTVLFFAPLPLELDIWPLLVEGRLSGKTIALPRFSEPDQTYRACEVRDLAGDLCRGRFGIREPSVKCAEIPLKQLDLVLAPGVAFDVRGRRLGRGKGYYDRLLAAVRGSRCGVAFEQQMVAAVPVEPHDVSVDCILTPTRWLVSEVARGL